MCGSHLKKKYSVMVWLHRSTAPPPVVHASNWMTHSDVDAGAGFLEKTLRSSGNNVSPSPSINARSHLAEVLNRDVAILDPFDLFLPLSMSFLVAASAAPFMM